MVLFPFLMMSRRNSPEYYSKYLELITVNSEIFARILFSRIALKHIFSTLKIRQGRDLPISVNDRMISPIHEDFIFAKLRKFCENNTLAKISEFTVYIVPP